jgi:fructose-1-phosphate kinase PfkB-like protein
MRPQAAWKVITQETACFALLREERQVQRFRASIPRVEPIARVGAGDVLLGGYLSERFNGRADADALRTAVGCAAASVVELGAGRFERREAARLAAGVEIVELAPVEA